MKLEKKILQPLKVDISIRAQQEQWLFKAYQKGLKEPDTPFVPKNPNAVTGSVLETAHGIVKAHAIPSGEEVTVYPFACFDNTSIMLNSLIPTNPGSPSSTFYNIPHWGERFVGPYAGLCPLEYVATMRTSNLDVRPLYNLDQNNKTNLVQEVINPVKVFCYTTKLQDHEKVVRKQQVRQGTDVIMSTLL